MTFSLLSTKLHIPRPRVNGVARPRLTAKLIAALDRPSQLILISAPAGFGKTTLLAELAADHGKPVAWISLGTGDNDPNRFWSYVIVACQSIRPGVGESALALLQTPQPLADETIPTLLINDLANLEKDLVLVLDDYHTVQNETIHSAICFLLDHIPDHLHIVISTRVDPPWPLARLRARDQLVEIRVADLRFTSDETAAFLNQVMGLNLSAGNIAALELRTEGWIASLQLAAISMRGRSDVTGFIKDFTGSHVYVAEYLIEEVLERQPEEVKTFLLQTSILGRLNAGLCETVSGRADSQDVLKYLYQSNLFVHPLDDEGQWFRYHHLFADLLQARMRHSLSDDDIAALHRRAAAWYEQTGMISEAMEHSLAAKDYSHAIQIIGSVALPMILQAHVRTVDGWLQSIPQTYLEESPELNMAFAWLNLLRGTFSEATPYAERLFTMFSSTDMSDQNPSMHGEWLAMQSRLLSVQGKMTEGQDLANQALQILPETAVHIRNLIYINQATIYQQTLDYDHAAETFQMIVRDSQATGNFTFEILGSSGQAQMLLQQGKLRASFEIASQGVRRLEVTGKTTPFSATLYGELGQIHYHWHQLDQARSYLLRSIQASGPNGYSDPEIYHHVMLSRMFQMDEDWEAAAREMQKASDLAKAIPPTMTREHVLSQQVRVDLSFGRFAAAQSLLTAEGFTFSGACHFPDLAPGAIVTDPLGMLYNSALRFLLVEARTTHKLANLRSGIELAGLVLAGELQCRHIPVALETILLRSQLHAALGEDQNSLTDVIKALQLGEPEGFISTFVEEGQPIAEALTTLLKRNLYGTVKSSYIREILAAFPGSQSSNDVMSRTVNDDLAPIVPLTPREMEVLHLIVAGDSNQTIADKLVITLSAVKKHTGNILKKLSVSNRTQAVARARLIGLLT
jgi:LuxR family maltose regulon positive regulatory protein